jgi:hypothetical protein
MEVVVRRVGDVTRPGRRSFCVVFRRGLNDWVVVVGDVDGSSTDITAVRTLLPASLDAAASENLSPSRVVGDVHRALGARRSEQDADRVGVGLVVARIELDSCGAWVTFAGVGHARPMVLRHAGWVDIRSFGPLPSTGDSVAPSDDRVGLGPGDAVILPTEVIGGSRDVEGSFLGEKLLPDVLVDQHGQSSATIADSLVNATNEFAATAPEGDGILMVLRVPEIVRHQGLQWVAQSTGASVEDVRLPGYSMRPGPDGVADQPVLLPREALIRLRPEPPSIPALRRLLRRLSQSWRIDALAEGDLELLASEVATHAFSRTASPVTVIVRYTGAVVRVEVGDGERQVPRKRRLTFEGLHGHRLALVESLAASWGVATTSTGSRMWFEVAATRS